MNLPLRNRLKTGKQELLLVPASATQQAASTCKKGLAAFSDRLLGQESDNIHKRCWHPQTTLKKCFLKPN